MPSLWNCSTWNGPAAYRCFRVPCEAENQLKETDVVDILRALSPTYEVDRATAPYYRRTDKTPTERGMPETTQQVDDYFRYIGKGKGKSTYTWYSASSWIIISEALRYGTYSQGIAVFPVHVLPQPEWAIPAFAFPAIAGTHLPTLEGWKAWVAGYVVRQFTC